MAITAAQVKELREMSGAGMMDCKKALNETNGDMEAAIELLRKNGVMKAEKKASRIAAEGIVHISMNDNKACIVEVNSETDFVAKNETFTSFVASIADQVLNGSATNVEELLSESYTLDSSKTVKDALTEKIATIGENLNIRRFQCVSSEGALASYIHGGGRIGVIVNATTDKVDDNIKAGLRNIAMQIAAMNPKYVSQAEVSDEYKAHELEILLAQAKVENEELPENKRKPDAIIEKMIIGRLNKELKEVCLLDQPYVQDPDLTVKAYVENLGKASGANLSIKSFVRFETGEGIEKKSEDFAAEVAAQING